MVAAIHPLDPISSALPSASVLAVWALLLCLAAWWLAGRRPAPGGDGAAPVPHHAAEPLRGGVVFGRALGLALLMLAIVAGRVGSPRELSNIAPALVIGVAWPALVVGSLLLGRVSAALDPWDTLARLVRAPVGEPPRDVWPAVIVALLWTGWLAVPFDPFSPGIVGLILAGYSLLMLAGCLASGRVNWLGRAELFGLLSGWLAPARRLRLGAWTPPIGAAAVLGVLAGGLLFGELRRTTVWGPLAVRPGAVWWNVAGLLIAALVVAAPAERLARSSVRRTAGEAVAVGLLPLVAGIALAASLARDRVLVAAQLVLSRASDPLGRGWDLFGTADWPVRPSPLGHTGRDLAQWLLVVAGGAAALWLARRRDPAGRVVPGFLAALSALAVLVLQTH